MNLIDGAFYWIRLLPTQDSFTAPRVGWTVARYDGKDAGFSIPGCENSHHLLGTEDTLHDPDVAEVGAQLIREDQS